MRVLLLGRTEFLLATGQELAGRGHSVVGIWTSPAGTHYRVGPSDLQALAHSLHADFVNDANLNSRQNFERLKQLNADIAVSVNWPVILTKSILSLFPLGILNAHAGDLPRYRGNACPNWAILNGETRIGLCVHKMVEELDAGPILIRDYLPLHDQVYIEDVYAWMEQRIPLMFYDAIEALSNSTLSFVAQSEDRAFSLRCYPRRPEDGKIEWNEPTLQVHRLIRATSRPLSGAFTTLERERRLIIWRAEPITDHPPFCAVPGQVCYRLKDDPVIACGKGLLRITDMELEGSHTNAEAKTAVLRNLRQRLI